MPSSRSCSRALSKLAAGTRSVNVPLSPPEVVDDRTEPPFGAGDRDHALELIAEAPVRDRHGDRAVPDDLGQIRRCGGALPVRPSLGVLPAHARRGVRDPARGLPQARSQTNSRRRSTRLPPSGERTPAPCARTPMPNASASTAAATPSPARTNGRRRVFAGEAIRRCSARATPVRSVSSSRKERELGIHHSTSVARVRPRSCSTIAIRRSPRLTRWRAAASAHPSRVATSG